MRLREFMQAPVFACSPTATVAMAAREMEAHNVGSLVVTDSDEHIVGILTDRDLALSLAHGHDGALAVSEAMSADVVTIPDDADVHDAAATMDSHGVRRLPVADEEGRPVGIICLDDLYNYLTQEAITLYGAVRAQGAPQP
jgi:CBS domain-containing protein